MDHLTRNQLSELAAANHEVSVSIYMPLHRTPGETEQDPIRLRNLLDEAENSLAEAGHRATALRDLLEPARALQKDRSIWRPTGDEGLALFLAPGYFASYRLPFPLPDSVDVGTSFHVAPLAHALVWDETFLLLALAEKHVRLFRCNRREIVPVALPPKMPTSLQQALAGTELEKSLQHHATTPGGAGKVGIVHGHGDPKDYQKVQLTEYFRIVAGSLDELFKAEGLPVILAAVEYYHPLFHQPCKYPGLLKEGIVGSPDELKESELLERALPLVQPWFKQRLKQAAARYSRLAGNSRASRAIPEILAAAHQGRVESLFAELGTRVWGRFEPENAQADVHDDRQPGDVDLLDLAVKKSLTSGSDVYVVPPDDVPGSGPAAAVFRWQIPGHPKI